MVHYKLYYFDLRGRGEPIRQIFALAGQKYEDIRIPLEKWSEFKSVAPLGVMPFLDVGKPDNISQSLAIMRYLGNEFNLVADTPYENARLDMIGDTMQDFLNMEGVGKELTFVILGKSDQNKDEFYKEKTLPAIEQFAPHFENWLKLNGSKGVFSGDKVTWVDIFVAEMFCRLVEFANPHAIDNYSNIQALIKRVHELPQIKEHIAEREATLC